MFILIKLFLLIFAVNANENLHLNADDNDSLSVTISIRKPAESNDSIPLVLTYSNKSKTNIRLLKIDGESTRFVSAIVTDKNTGYSYFLPGTGKMSFSPDTNKSYVVIAPGEYYSEIFNLNKLLKKQGKMLSKGDYSVRLTYRNQYGENCFHGIAESNDLIFSIAK